MTANCLNCQVPILPEHQFCSNCGQSKKVHPISFPYLFQDLIHGFTHADIGIFHTIKMLAIKPGLVAREYLEGKRKKYFPPMNFYLILVGLFVFTLGFFHTFEQPGTFAQAKEQVRKIPNAVQRERMLKKMDRAETAMTFMTKKSNLVSLLVATPLAALLFFLFYFKRGYNYAEHLVANLYFSGFSSLFFILIIAPLISFMDNQTFYLTAIGVFLIGETVYRSIAYYQFINRKGIKHYLYALLASIIVVGAWIFLSGWAIRYYIEHGIP